MSQNPGSGVDENLKVILEHARSLFTYHAEQRHGSLNFYFAVLGAFVAGYVSLFTSEKFWATPGLTAPIIGMIVGVAAFVLTVLFGKLDRRNADLVWRDEQLLKHAERELQKKNPSFEELEQINSDDPPPGSMSKEKYEKYHYKVVVPRILLVFKFVWGFAILGSWAYWYHAKGNKAAEAVNLATFDDLDFNVFSGQKWEELALSHAPNITVHWPDGRTTRGIHTHTEDLKGMFVFAPDTRIYDHPIKIASGDWTSVTGIMEGTFMKPMPTAGGKTIPPTGKAFRISMVTIGHWKNGVMVEEWLMWDNQAFMKQIGLAN
jgi:predicted ester cyclase